MIYLLWSSFDHKQLVSIHKCAHGSRSINPFQTALKEIGHFFSEMTDKLISERKLLPANDEEFVLQNHLPLHKFSLSRVQKSIEACRSTSTLD